MTEDHYQGAANGWATAAALVYGSLAAELVGRAPHPLTGRRVLDAGAGTGVASALLREAGAHPVAADLSHHMLRWRHQDRPPAVVGDVTHLPLRTGIVDDAVAAFVLNHLPEPVAGLAELARVTRPGGVVLASVFANTNHSEARDLVDEVATGHGFTFPDWYKQAKANTIPMLGSRARMAAAAEAAGLVDVRADEQAVPTQVRTAGQLVDYRLGQPHYAGWLASRSTADQQALRQAAIEAVTPVMQPYRPRVVILVARAG